MAKPSRPYPGMLVRAWVDTTDGKTIHTQMRIDRVTTLGCGCHRLECVRPGPRDTPPQPAVHVLTGACDRHTEIPPVEIRDGPIGCGGRPVTDTGQHTGDPCRAVHKPHGPHPGEDQARAAGWAIGRLPDGTVTAICPRCRRPDPTTVATCRDLERSLHTR